ncbi:MAG TPA: NAD-dependent epimerase/dehydratase family protein [Candidatus Lustribacter sp.]
MAVLITGGAGFVGSHLSDRLVERGEHVVVCDDLSTGRLANLNRGLASGALTFVYLDVAAPLDVIRETVRAATTERFTAVFHLASAASPVAYGEHPWETLAVNALGTMSMIDFAREENARILFTSTSEIYGDPLIHPQSEEYFGNVNPIGPRACYDEGKRFGEAAMSVAIRERGLDGRIVRIFNCYGPRMDLADGRVVPAYLSAAREQRPFPIQGSGLQTRSMTYVDDLIDGLLTVAAAEFLSGQPINLGSEDETTMIDLARVVAEIAGVPFEIDAQTARPEDPQRRKPDITRARALGWRPRTSLREGLRRTYTWALGEALEYA